MMDKWLIQASVKLVQDICPWKMKHEAPIQASSFIFCVEQSQMLIT